jgi:1,4-dihydroxy-2-naphthoate octaprenyltransferase
MPMRKLLNFTRHNEWWEYKLVPLLTVGYASIYFNNYNFNVSIIRLLILLVAVIVGATYVSIINDLTDIDEDAKAGKNNRMADKPYWLRALLVIACILIGVYFGYIIYPDTVSILFYSMSWIVFTLYSVPPFRLKKRGLWGVFCDASGAHLFPALLVAYNLSTVVNISCNITWLTAIGIWALAYGLRGILWHQFYDRDNDLASNTTTFATRINPANFRIPETVLFILEIGAFSIMLFYLFNLFILLSIVCYLLLVIIRIKAFRYQTTIIISPKAAPYQLLMNDYYLCFFPVALLITNAINYQYGWIVLIVHLLLFPRKTIFVFKDYRLFLRQKFATKSV